MKPLTKSSLGLLVALDAVERMVVALLLGHFAWTLLRSWYETGDVAGPILLASEGAPVVFCVIRRFAADVSLRPTDWLLAALGTTVPLLAMPAGGGALAPTGLVLFLMLAGLGLQILAKLTLRRSFGLVAANRGVKMGGPYRLVRHPMYAGYAVTPIGFLLANPSVWNLAVYALGFTCQLGRIAAEERVLGRDASYRAFAAAVPHRLIPGLF